MRRELSRGGLAAIAVGSLMAIAAAPAQAAPAPSPAKGGAKAVCLAAHEEAQSLRAQKKPHAALEKFVACARVECPTVVRKECIDQVALVEKDAPTITLGATDEAGKDTTAVTVTMDGGPLADKLTGAAVDVEPGEHVFRFERADGKAIEQRVLVIEGDKNRKVIAEFASLLPKPPVDAGVKPSERKKVPVLAFVAGGVAIAALGSFTFFALSGKGQEKDLASSCGPNCKDDELSPVKRDYLIADVSLAIGVVAAATALILAWPALSDAPRTSSTATIARPRAPNPWMPRITVRAP